MCETDLLFATSLTSTSILQSPSKECDPYRTSDGLPIAPCGAIANSLFNGKLSRRWADVTVPSCRFFPVNYLDCIVSWTLSEISYLECTFRIEWLVYRFADAAGLFLYFKRYRIDVLYLALHPCCVRRHSRAVLPQQRDQDRRCSDEEGHRLVDGQARQVQEPGWKWQSYRCLPRSITY